MVHRTTAEPSPTPKWELGEYAEARRVWESERMEEVMNWDSITDEEMLIEMDDFGDSHTTIHEAAKRIRAKNAHIAALEAEAGRVRAEAFRELDKEIGREAQRVGIELSPGLFIAHTIIERLRKQPIAQPKTEAEALTFKNLNASTT